MVYESDFYTTRRPYSRPTITSYSVTVPVYHHSIPYIAHKKLAMVTPSAHGWRVNKSVLLGEIDRIYHKVRPSLAYQPTEDYLNSRAIVSFDDETRSIRAQTADLLKKIYTPVPRAHRPLPLTGELLRMYSKIKNLTMRLVIYPRYLDNYGAYYSYSELPITERITSDHYIDRLLSGPRDVHSNVLTMSYYDEPARRYAGIGKGHLACVSFAGGRPFSRRKNLAPIHDNIRNDINVLSHYGRFRAAAAAANVHDSGKKEVADA
ncbi:UNVERIFIED_CONTAM: hypothetical protein PYX00_007147 [Menopon gallinae]|uniref:Uncharacterized protein n=1 Tax=Menopon gallinae TaxID=328185 RepID=A0AAW2HI56_9NEOP